MKVTQITTTIGHDCGIALFANNLQIHLRRAGMEMETFTALPADSSADIILLHHHDDLMDDEKVISLAGMSPSPVVLFAHSDGAHRLCAHVAGIACMQPDMVGTTDTPTHIFQHPAWVPPYLENRTELRREFGLPENRLVVGTHGFLKFERQFAKIVETLIPMARDKDWFIELITSPWRLDSPGLIAKLDKLQRYNQELFRFEYNFIDEEMLNRRLQACDMLWCWTAAPSSNYASGVISDQYASGTRIFAANKKQHEHVFNLPNTIAGPDLLSPFIEQLKIELYHCDSKRHDPSPVSWDNVIQNFFTFLSSLTS